MKWLLLFILLLHCSIMCRAQLASYNSSPVTVNQKPHPHIFRIKNSFKIDSSKEDFPIPLYSVKNSYQSYQWYNGAIIIPGATNNMLTVTGHNCGVYSFFRDASIHVIVDSGGHFGSSDTLQEKANVPSIVR